MHVSCIEPGLNWFGRDDLPSVEPERVHHAGRVSVPGQLPPGEWISICSSDVHFGDSDEEHSERSSVEELLSLDEDPDGLMNLVRVGPDLVDRMVVDSGFFLSLSVLLLI